MSESRDNLDSRGTTGQAMTTTAIGTHMMNRETNRLTTGRMQKEEER
ncbi:hypothetical protein [Bifidobacterium tibiigranuli]|nr:hypothetical protein [Bifidobacterium tibiigranuli]MCI1212350.1 hypothetical protein [Bifidobacterium tibiigranuli]MCI1222075.1 hypothetical protein [Bifidobacterium tibiigranuli]MCI1232927.1 hypothetical protein [Bifidobacterium tibiigranuli]MCI1254905.1 hypothetical protein [Bifidobacterium tibiigranuli]